MLLLPILSVDLVEAAMRSNGVLSSLDKEVLIKIEERYKKFLLLAQKYSNVALSPTFDIDEMWHLHMLHPRSYYNDCIRLFGDILDHNGGFGKKKEEIPTLISYANETQSLWEKEFGDELSTELSRSLKNSTFDRLSRVSAEVIECAIDRPSRASAEVIECAIDRPSRASAEVIECAIDRPSRASAEVIECAIDRPSRASAEVIECAIDRPSRASAEAILA